MAQPHVIILESSDADRLERFLAGRSESSMFLRSNLRRGGLVYEGKSYQAVYAAQVEGAELVGVAAHCWNGMMLLQAPTHAPQLAQAAWEHSGRPLGGLIGPWDQLQAAIEGLGLRHVPTQLSSSEELYALQLKALVVPPPLQSGACRVRRGRREELELLSHWRQAFCIEALGEADTEEGRRSARVVVERCLQEGSMFVLETTEGPVATSAFNASLPDCVQVGAVWTPPELRARGYARAVVAGSLLDARAQGVERGVLFTGASNAPARRAYEALGFERVGSYGLWFFQTSQPLGASSAR